MTDTLKPRVIAYGEALIDMILQRDGSYKPVPGGSPMNTAVALGRLGYSVSVVSPVSNDGFGNLIETHISASGVDHSLLIQTDAPTTLAMATLDHAGEANYSFYINGCSQASWYVGDLKKGPQDGDILTVSGSFALAADPMGSVFDKLFEAASPHHVISFDPNIRPAVIGDDRIAALDRFDRWVGYSTIVKASAEDMAWRYPDLSIEDAAQKVLELGAKLVVITDGDRGAYAATPSVSLWRTAPEVEVVDTVGAGDTFHAGLLAALIEKNIVTKDAIESISEADLVDCVDYGIVIAADTCTREGANPPWRGQSFSYDPAQAVEPHRFLERS